MSDQHQGALFQNSISRRSLLRAAGIMGGVAISGAFLASCATAGGGGNAPGSSGTVTAAAPTQPVSIEFWRRNYSAGGTNADSVTTDAAIKAFQKRYPTITVVPKGDPAGAETNQKYDIAILQQRSGPDVFSTTGPELFKYAAAGAVAKPDIPAAVLSDYPAQVLDASRVNGELPGYPLWVVPWFQYLNLRRFREFGVTPPGAKGWTYEEFLDSAKRLTGTGSDGQATYGWAFYTSDYSFMLLDGARPLSADGKQWTFSSDTAISAMNKWSTVVKEQATVPGVVAVDFLESGNLFRTGNAAILQNPSALATDLLASPDWVYGEDWDVAPSPSGSAAQTTWTALGYVGILNQDDQAKVAAAQLFAQYISGDDVGPDLMADGIQWWQAPAARISARGAFASYAPAKAKIASFLDSLYVQPNLPQWSEIDGKYLRPARDQVLTGQASAQQALTDIAEPAQQLVDESGH